MIKIGGIVPFTTIDYPNELATVLFCQGCPLNCHYCHNLHLKSFTEIAEEIPFKDALTFLKSRQKMINAVVISGGEPLFQPKLKQAIEILKLENFKIALHTSGSNFEILNEVYDLLDFIAMDFKVSYEDYDILYRNKEDILKSLKLIASEKVKYEVRTTLDPNLLTKEKVMEIALFLKEIGIKNYALQLCRSTESYNVDNEQALSFFIDNNFIEKIKSMFISLEIRK